MLDHVADQSVDAVIMDPPYYDNVMYAELSDFFYVWLRLVLKERYADYFTPEYTPKALEVVANRARQPEDPDVLELARTQRVRPPDCSTRTR